MNRPKHYYKLLAKDLGDGAIHPDQLTPMEAALLDWPAFLVLLAEMNRVEQTLRESNRPQQLSLEDAL